MDTPPGKIDKVFLWLTRVYFVLSPVPPLLHAYLYWRIGQISGWGAIAAAQMIQYSVLASLAGIIIGGLLLGYRRWRGYPIGRLAVASLVASLPALHLLVLLLLR